MLRSWRNGVELGCYVYNREGGDRFEEGFSERLVGCGKGGTGQEREREGGQEGAGLVRAATIQQAAPPVCVCLLPLGNVHSHLI